MITVRQIERAWKAQQFERLFADLAATRPEAALRNMPDGGWAAVAAAMALIRLDELGQSHLPFSATLIRAVVSAQQTDGGWGDLIATAICLRALLCSNGNGISVDLGMVYLALLQKNEGIWPNVPVRRMPQDAGVSALVLYELGDQPIFHQAVRVGDAIAWYQLNQDSIERNSRALWHRGMLRCQRHAITRPVANWLAA
jgi:hypothetical protein